MKDEEKNQFDAVAAIRDHAWNEFQEKSALEWRLSLAVWAAILGAAGAILSVDELKVQVWSIYIVGGGLLAVIGLHLRFLWWIQSRLREERSVMLTAQEIMKTMVGISSGAQLDRNPLKQATLQVQLAITAVLAGILVAILCQKA